MANYRISIANRTYDVTILDDSLEVNGDKVTYDVDSLDGRGLHILRQHQRNVEAHVEAKNPGDYEVQIDGNHLNARVAVGFNSPRETGASNDGRIVAPMPGLIVDLLVKAGDRVAKGQTLLIQEAMKMQMKLRSPFEGVVAGVSIKPGLQVDKGTLLVSLQPS
jgi:biotin carboxyl carrier protein